MKPDNSQNHQNFPELFDVVDLLDRVVGQARRQEVHRQGYLHRSVHVLVFNKKGELLLQLRSMGKDTYPDCWDSSASGHVDSGEDYLPAAKRELFEELGVRGDRELQFLTKIKACRETGWEFSSIYRLEYGGPFCIDPGEVQEVRWMSGPAVHDLLANPLEKVAPSFRLIWSLFQ